MIWSADLYVTYDEAENEMLNIFKALYHENHNLCSFNFFWCIVNKTWADFVFSKQFSSFSAEKQWRMGFMHDALFRDLYHLILEWTLDYKFSWF